MKYVDRTEAKIGDIVILIDNEMMSAKIGAEAKVVKFTNYLEVKWLDEQDHGKNKRNGQCNGGYNSIQFKLKITTLRSLLE